MIEDKQHTNRFARPKAFACEQQNIFTFDA